MDLKEVVNIEKVWTIRRYANDEDFRVGKPSAVRDSKTGELLPAESVVVGNLLLNEGIQLMLDLLIGAGGTVFSNANSYLGVGDSSTAAAATQTALQASTNKVYVAVESTYPSRSNQTLTWRSIFTSAVGNFAWNEFTVANGNSDSGVNLNRLVSAQGTKASGQTWTLDLAITVS